MKKLLLFLTLGFLIGLTLSASTAYASNSISVYINNEELEFDVPPELINGRTMVPVRGIFESLGAKVDWNGEKRTVTGIKDEIEIILQIDNKIALVNEVEITLDMPATVLNGRTLVPARFISESLGAEVIWDAATQTVYINNTDQYSKTKVTRSEFFEALANLTTGWIYQSDPINNEYITEREMKLHFVRSIDYDSITGEVPTSKNLAKEIVFDMYQKILQPIEELHGFYAINSYPQIDLIPDFNSIGFGWSRLEVDREDNSIMLKVDKNNSFYIPDGFSKPLNKAYDNEVSPYLMIFASQFTRDANGMGIIERVITDPDERKSVIRQIIDHSEIEIDSEVISFEGIVIDFEDLTEKRLANYFNIFLQELRAELDQKNKSLYVMVQPLRYYQGYDYRTIGEIADKVILMAHDYYPRNIESLNVSDAIDNFYDIESPLTPIENIINKEFDLYHALKDITDEETGVADKDKIMLQISFDAVQWRKGVVDDEVKVWRNNPLYSSIKERILFESERNGIFQMNYNKTFENPYFTYYDQEKNIDNIIWYEDTRSVLTKINLAKLFDIRGISIWRLGNIPDYSSEEKQFMFLDTWQQILKQTGGYR